MYIYYEEFSDVYVLTLSTNGRDTFVRRQDKKEWAYLEFINSLFKQIPLENRDFNDKNKVWTFLGYKGKVIITQLESMCLQGLFGPESKVVAIKDLEEKAVAGTLNQKSKEEKARKFTAEEFFYNPHDSSSASDMAKPKLISRLAPLLNLTTDELCSPLMDDKQLKKYYRAAALRLHPDRNNGDGSKMSELNMLWGIYTSQGA